MGRGERFELKNRPGGITSFIAFAILPGGGKISADRGPVPVYGAGHLFADDAGKGYATQAIRPGGQHAAAEGGELSGEGGRDPIRRKVIDLCPIE